MTDRFRIGDQRKAVDQFLRSEVKNLNAATATATKVAARALKREVQKELRSNFKPGRNSNGAFFKAVKVRDLPADPARGLGPASFVRLGVPFMGIFQEGGTVQGKGSLIILLPEGERLGFKRISKGNPWGEVQRRWGKFLFPIKVSDGLVIGYENPKTKTRHAVYKFQPQVTLPKKLSFLEMAEEIGDAIPDTILDLMEGNYG